MITVEVAGAALVLLPQRAAYAPEFGTLLVADAHIGKAASFRRLGVPVPCGTTAENLDRLTDLLSSTEARRVVFLGDLMHSVHGLLSATVEAVAAWRARHAGVAMTLVRGNHDARAGAVPAAWSFETTDRPLRLGPWLLTHEPGEAASGYVIAGHVHPAFVLGAGPRRLRLPCFHFGRRVGVLPAFGAFTGGHGVLRQPGDRVFVVADDQVRHVPLGH